MIRRVIYQAKRRWRQRGRQICAKCGGTGWITDSWWEGTLYFTALDACHACLGDGYVKRS